MSRKVLLQIRRGTKAQLPTLADGELGFCIDTEELYIGTANGNVLLNSKGDTGLSIAYGQYLGDGSEFQNIYIGIAPKILHVNNEDPASQDYEIHVYPFTKSGWVSIVSGDNYFTVAGRYFGGIFNDNGIAYTWTAIW